MADIFDSKEEVLDVVLTRKGREMMSKGIFEPFTYEFYDSDIVYDANNSENQNESSTRIKEGLYQKATTARVSNIKSAGSLVKDDRSGKDVLVIPEEIEFPPAKLMDLKNPIGTYQIGTQNAPAWNINFVESTYMTGSNIFSNSTQNIVVTDINDNFISSDTLSLGETNEERIPQFYVNVKTKLYQIKQKIKGGGNLVSLYSDKRNENLVLSVEENNVFTSGEDPEFEVEVFLIEEENGGRSIFNKKTIKQMFFDKENFDDFDSVENYLSILFDEEARFESNFKQNSIYNELQINDEEECD
tara:strand:- start:159 stop:1061 length:903 start_codon:yes stop_codon:yes gene_type:complete